MPLIAKEERFGICQTLGMENILQIIGNAAQALVLVGASISVLFIIMAGFLYATSEGDPQKQMRARNAFLATLVGVLIMGVAFLVPGIISEQVLEPSGGATLQVDAGTDCDSVLRRLLVVTGTASHVNAVNRLVTEIQARRDVCRADVWSPEAVPFEGGRACVSTGSPPQVGDFEVPASLKPGGGSTWGTARDAGGNIIVFWSVAAGARPSDGSLCWFYSGSFKRWISGYGS